MTQPSTPSSTTQQSNRPWQFRFLNWTGEKIPLKGLPLLDFKEQSLLDTAQNMSGLSDWGDEGFRTPLKRLLTSLETEAHLNLVGRYFLRQYCIRLLVNRLKLQADLKRYPEILQVPIQRPLFVVGMFRSGTTFLHNLLSCDPGSRWLHVGEALSPSPPPDVKTWDNDDRLQETAQFIQLENSLASKFYTAHYIDVNRPAECSRLFEYGFIAHLFDFRGHLPSYSQWLRRQDLLESYGYYRQQLQYLSWRWSGSHWLLKAPAHLLALEHLLTVFPDACIVHIHRDPIKVLPSCCSLAAMGRGRFSDQVDPHQLGKHWLSVLTQMVETAMKSRHKLDSQRFYDVQYTDFVKDPRGTVRQIYNYFGYPSSPEMEQNLTHWIEQNPQHKRGVHRYSLEQFGLTSQEIDQCFGNYYQHFKVHLER